MRALDDVLPAPPDARTAALSSARWMNGMMRALTASMSWGGFSLSGLDEDVLWARYSPRRLRRPC